MFKAHNNHSPRLMSPYRLSELRSPRDYRLSARHGDGRAYNTTDTILFAVWDVVGGLLLGATFFFVGVGIVGGFQ